MAVNSKIATIAKKGELTTQEELIKSAYAESEISGKFPQSKWIMINLLSFTQVGVFAQMAVLEYVLSRSIENKNLKILIWILMNREDKRNMYFWLNKFCRFEIVREYHENWF